MNCQQAQQEFDQLSRNRLDETKAVEVRRHLDDCTDCRVQWQRLTRLQRLLALKNHEQPTPAYWDGFLDEFHRRLEAETASRGFWRQLSDRWATAWAGFNPAPYLRPAMATVSMVALCASTVWLSWRTLNPSSYAISQVIQRAGEMAVLVDTAPAPLPVMAAPVPSNNVGVILPDEDSDVAHTRYVMDRITVTPVNHEVSNIDF
jgi:hypothetical protein